MTRPIKGVRKVAIRPFLSELLGLDTRQVSRLFNGADKRIDVNLVREYLVRTGVKVKVPVRTSSSTGTGVDNRAPAESVLGQPRYPVNNKKR